ncbi:Pr6Pr family membrane protein [Microbacterium sp. NPDC091382]|uniref:Pr6Pr family membrane protein n=1 Tax=Microbacterium sp. NPDC091382 TaxID=3364210 RepID=UPI0037FD39BE
MSVARIFFAALTAVAIVATFFDTASRSQINPFNFFGYFTIQSNLFVAVVWAIAGISGLRNRTPSRALVLARAFAATYIVVVGLVYAVFLAPLGAAGGVALPWANVVLHLITPVLAMAGWLVATDRAPIRWRLLPLVLLYPLVWISVVLVRGATDGWVPYPFLDPDRGYALIALVCVGIAAAVTVIATIVFFIAQLPRRGATPRRQPIQRSL